MTGLCGAAGANSAAPAAHVLDDVLLSEMLGQLLRDEATDRVVLATGSEGNDHAHRPRGIGLRPGNARDGRQRDSACGQMQETPAWDFHDGLTSQAPKICGHRSRPQFCRGGSNISG
jgi:hypothetical protein